MSSPPPGCVSPCPAGETVQSPLPPGQKQDKLTWDNIWIIVSGFLGQLGSFYGHTTLLPFHKLSTSQLKK